MYICGVCIAVCVSNQFCYCLISEKTESEQLPIGEIGSKNVHFLDETSFIPKYTKMEGLPKTAHPHIVA